jgi:DNA-binding NarL/FixJ family response regulator
MTVVLLSTDLTVVSRVDGAAAGAGMTMRAVSSESAAIVAADAASAKLLIIDLGAPVSDLKVFVESFKSKSPQTRIIAFGPHVHEEKLAAARVAGCDEVVSRGQFFSQLDAILRR